jgi:hypothetical protein
MSRTRMFGAITAVVACAGFAAGCGGGGYSAAETTPTPGAAAAPAAPAASAAPATPGVQSAIGQFAPSDPATARDQTFAGYERFSRNRAQRIFIGPAPVTPAAAPATAPEASPGGTPLASVPPPSGSTTPATSPSGSTTSPVPAPAPVSTKLSASIQIDDAVQTVVVGNQVPKEVPQFTVQAITDSKVVLAVLTGTVPGGGTTLELFKDTPVQLTNPDTGVAMTLTVKEIKPEV